MGNNCLYHHGVIGQKWGIRRYQNADGSLTPLGREHYGVGKFGDRRTPDQLIRKTIPVGSTFYRIQRRDAGALGNQNGGVYVYNAKDRNNLRSITPWLAKTQNSRMKDFEEVELKTTKPIKVASLKDVDDAVSEMLNSNKRLADKVVYLEEEIAMMNVKVDADKLRSGLVTEKELVKDLTQQIQDRLDKSSFLKRAFSRSAMSQYNDDKLLLKDVKAQARRLINSANVANVLINHYGNDKIDDYFLQKTISTGKDEITRRLADDSEIQSYIYDILKKKGFNAMYDNNMINAGLSSRPIEEAHEPLVLLDNASLEKTGNAERMSEDKAYRAELEFQKYANMQQRGNR